MSPNRKAKNLIDVLGYTMPRLHDKKEWYIDFYYLDPETGESVRKKYTVGKMKSKRERKAYAETIIAGLNAKLRQGWLPFVENKNIRGGKLFDEVLEQYLINLCTSHRKTSIDNYRSRVNVLREYMATLANPPKYAYQYDRTFVRDYLDWILTERKTSARTVNNYRGWCSALAEYMMERNYISENPVDGVKKMQEGRKGRLSLDGDMLHRLFLHLNDTDRYFLLACMMQYYTFIRPNELSHLKIGDISVKERTVFIAAEVSKNKKDGKVSLNDDILRLMLDLNVLRYPCDHYLFGPGFMPSRDKCSSDMFNKRWANVRKELHWPSAYKFYSLKDSGIRDLSNTAGVVTARDQARHHDISTTNKYLEGRDLQPPEAAKHFKGKLR